MSGESSVPGFVGNHNDVPLNIQIMRICTDTHTDTTIYLPLYAWGWARTKL